MRALAEEAGIGFVSDSPTEPKVERDPAQIEPALRRLKEAEVDFLHIPPSNFFGAHAELFTRTATDLGLPTFCGVETPIRQHCMTGWSARFMSWSGSPPLRRNKYWPALKNRAKFPSKRFPGFLSRSIWRRHTS